MDEADERNLQHQRENPHNPGGWGGFFQGVATGFKRLFHNEKRLTGPERERAAAEVSEWERRRRIETKAASEKRSFLNASHATLERADWLAGKGRVEESEQKLLEGRRAGLFTQEVFVAQMAKVRTLGALRDEDRALGLVRGRELNLDAGRRWVEQSKYIHEEAKPGIMLRLEHAHAAAKEEAHVAEAMEEDPTDTLAKLRDAGQFWRLSDDARRAAMSRASVLQEAEAQAEVGRARERIGMLTPEELKVATVESLGVELRHASPLHRMMVENELRRRQGPDGRREGDIFRREVMALASGYVAKDDPTGVLDGRIRWLANSLPAEERDEVMTRLDGVRKAGSTHAELAPTLALLHDLTQGSRRVFGTFEASRPSGEAGDLWKDLPGQYMPAGVAQLSELMQHSQGDGASGSVGVLRRGSGVSVDKGLLAAVQAKEEAVRRDLELEAAKVKPGTLSQQEWQKRLYGVLFQHGAKLDRFVLAPPRVAARPAATEEERKRQLNKILDDGGYKRG